MLVAISLKYLKKLLVFVGKQNIEVINLLESNAEYNIVCLFVCDRMVVGLTIPVQSVPITTEGSNPVHGEVYSTQHYVRKFVSDLIQLPYDHHQRRPLSIK
jgi:hypothetical protein